MKYDVLKKLLTTGLSTAVCIGGMSMMDLPSYSSNVAQNIYAATQYQLTGYANHAVYVRKGASTSYSKLGTLQKNAKVTILSKTKYGWYKINYKKGTGYVYGKYITLGSSSNKDTDNNNKDDNTTSLNVTGTANHAVYVRKGASTSYSKLGTLQKNAKVTVLSKTNSGWYKINFKNSTGYVYSQYIDLGSSTSDKDTNKDDNTTTLNVNGFANTAVYVRKGASTSYSKLGTLQKNAKVTVLSKTKSGWYKINYKNSTGYVYGKYITLGSSTSDKDTNKDDNTTTLNVNGFANTAVYVRKGASTSYSKLGTLQKNAKVTVLSKTNSGWYKINFKNSTGYVYGKYITLGSTSDKDTNKDDNTTALNVTGTANTDVNVRKGASTSYSTLGTLPKDAEVTVLSKTEYVWYKIQYKGTTGYVYGDYINLNSSTDKDKDTSTDNTTSKDTTVSTDSTTSEE